jgi:RNA polymerase sigma-70 factor (ECF subfamily)
MTPDKRIEIFEKEFLPHIEALKTFAYYLTYDEEDTNDLVQDTYLKAFKFVDKYDKGTNSKAWLFKILKNAYINEYRKKSRQPDRVDFEEVIHYHNDDDNLDNRYLDLKEEEFDSIMGDEVTQAINALPAEFRTVILLADIENFSYKEMSVILEVPLGTVRSRLFRARNALKELIKNYAGSLGYKNLRGNKTEEE